MKHHATCHPDRWHHSHGLCDSCRKPKYRGSRKRLLAGYNLNTYSYKKLLEKQNWACVICGKLQKKYISQKHKTRLKIDHCHKTNVIRGLLCATCNTGLGMFRDEPILLLNAILYLGKTSRPTDE
jgi:hypothetical protein